MASDSRSNRTQAYYSGLSTTVKNFIRVAAVIAGFAPMVSAQPNLSGAYQRSITINHAKVPNTDQTDFPVLIQSSYSYLATTANGGKVLNSNGYDIIFTSDSAGQQKLDFEIDSYNPSTGAANFWVRIPTLSHTADTTIYMFYGVPGVSDSQENKAGVWQNQYLSVYHFGNGSSVSTADSGSAGYTLSGSVQPTQSPIGGGISLTGDANVYLFHSSVPAYPTGQSPVTIEAWAQMSGASTAEIVGYGENSHDGSRAGLGYFPPNVGSEFENMGLGSTWTPDTQWHHYVQVYGGGALNTSTSSIYLDGIVLPATLYSGTPNITTTELKIGGVPTVTSCCAWAGNIDEVRVSAGIRSADWIATEYANQSLPSLFYTVSGETGGGGSAPTIDCSPAVVTQGSNTNCSVQLNTGATGQVSFSVDGQTNATASPNSSGQANALINLTAASIGTHAISFSYPGDGNNAQQPTRPA